MTDSLAALGAAVIAGAVTALLFYVWYAVTLAKVFAQLGGAPWKAWVPLVNESEIFRLGGVPAWQVVFFLVPVLSFYGLYLKVAAVSRLNAPYGRGTGATVLGILLPPVWSTLLSSGSGSPDPALQERIATSLEPRSGYAFAVSTPSSTPPGASVPPPLVAPPVPPSLVNPDAPPAAPVVPPPLLATPPATPPAPPLAPPAPPASTPAAYQPPAPPAPLAPPAPPLAPPAPAVAAPPAPAQAPAPEPPAPPATPVAAEPPAPPVAPPPPATQIVPPAGLLPPPPVVPAPPVTEAPEVPAQPWAPLGQPAAPPPAPVEPEPEPEPDGGDDELDRTVVVDRRPVVPWRLVVEGGPTFRLTGSSAVLGRRPAGAGAGAQEIAVPDPTRTLSKVHARLDLADGVWTVTDLNATNGVIVTRADGTEDLLDPGASAAISGRFVLGKVGMSLSFGEDAAAS